VLIINHCRHLPVYGHLSASTALDDLIQEELLALSIWDWLMSAGRNGIKLYAGWITERETIIKRDESNKNYYKTRA
jgi:hypothetical protein